MPLVSQSRLLFIHIPKNAGKYIEDRYGMSDFPGKDRNQKQRSFIGLFARLLIKFDSTYQSSRRKALRGMIDLSIVGQHLSLSEMQHFGLLDADLRDYKILTSARNPYTRMLSLYCHLVSMRDWNQSGFEDFCDSWPLGTRFERHALRVFRKCQSQFIVDINGQIPSNLHIVRVENLENDLIDFECKTGCKPSIFRPNHQKLKANNPLREPEKPAISTKAKKAILRHYKADFDFFGYEH